jgi:WD40 repeat protein
MNTTKQNPYVGPRTFETNEGDLFFGREREALDLFSLVVSERLVLFYAQSGAGKSSLINTKLKPALAEEGEYDVLPIGRVIGETSGGLEINNIYIYNLIKHLIHRDIEEVLLSKLTLSDFLKGMDVDDNNLYFYNVSPQPKLSGSDDDVTKKNVLIIDQFEELFTTHHESWEKREDFFKQLAQATQDFPNLWVVLVMREDYIAYLDPYVHLLPGRLRVRYYMQRLGREAAIEAVEGPARKSGRSYAKGVAKKLVDDLSGIKVQRPDGSSDVKPGQYVEPVQLQVVCFSLWDNLSFDGTQITEKDLQEVGDVNQSLEKHYARRVREVAELKGVNERAIRKWFGKNLITPGGIRNMILRNPSKREGELDDDVIQALQSDLVRAEKRGGVIFYELTHDRLVEPIIANNKKWEEENLSPLQRQAALWSDQDQNESWLLSDHALTEVEQWAKDHQDELTDNEKEFLEACRKLQAQIEERLAAERYKLEMANKFAAEQARSAKRAILFSIVSGVAVVIAIYFSISANKAKSEAENSQETAVVARVDAEKAKGEANNLADIARARDLAGRAKEIGNSLDLSMLLSAEAYNVPVENRDAQGVLFNNGQRSTRLLGFLASSLNPISQFRFSPDGNFLAAVRKDDKDYKHLILWDLNKGLQSEKDFGSSEVNQFFFSADNKYLVFLNQDGINFWDLEKKEQKVAVSGHVGEVTQIVYPDDKTFATLGENGDVIQWDASKSEHVVSPSQRGAVAVFSPDGKQFALFEIDKITMGNVAIADPSAPAKIPDPISRDPYSVTSMAFSQDGKLLAIADKDGNIDFWDLDNNKETGNAFSVTYLPKDAKERKTLSIDRMIFNSHGNISVYDSAVGSFIFDVNSEKKDKINNDPIIGSDPKFSPDGNRLSILSSNTITLYSTENGKIIGNSLPGSLAEFSRDGKTLAIFDKDSNKISLVNASTGESIGDLSQNVDAAPVGDPLQNTNAAPVGDPSQNTNATLVTRMAFSPDGNLLAVGSEDGSIKIWDINSKTIPYSDSSYSSFSGQVTSLAFSPDGKQLIAGRRDGNLSIWRRDSNISVWNLSETTKTNYPGKITSINLAPNGSFLYSIAKDGVALLDMKTLTPVGETLPGNDLQFVADNKVLLVFDGNSGVRLWNTTTSKLHVIEGDFVPFDSGGFFQFSLPKKQVMETKDKDGKLTFWNTLTGDELKLTGPSDTTVTYSLHDNFVFAINEGVISQFMDVSTGEIREGLKSQKILEPNDPNLSFSPKDNILITSNIAGQFDLWDTSTGEHSGKSIKFKNGQNPTAYYFSPSGNILITRSISDKFDLWDTRTGESLGEPINGGGTVIYNQQDGTSLYAVFNQDETRVITRTDNFGTNLWDLSTMKKIGESLKGSVQKISPDGQTVIMGDYYSASLIDFQSGKLIGKPVDGYNLNSTFNSDGKTLAISGYYNVTLWDMVKKKSVTIPTPAGGYFTDISWYGRMMVMSTSSREIKLWDATTGKQIGSSIRGVSAEPIMYVTINPLESIQSGQYSQEDLLVLSPDENTFVIFSPDGNLTLWNINTPTMPDNTVQDFPESITSALLSPDGNTLAASSKDGIALWDTLRDKKEVPDNLPNNHIKKASDVYLSTNHTTLVTNNNDGDLSIWDIGTGAPIGVPIHEAFCSFSPDGRILVTASSSYTYINYSSSYTYYYSCYSNSGAPMYSLWDTSTGKQIGDPFIGTYSFSSDGQLIIISSSGDSEFKIRKITKTGTQDLKFVQVGEPIPGSFQNFVAGSRFVTSLVDGNYKLWKTDTGDAKRADKPPIPTGNFVKSSPGGKSALFQANVYDYSSGTYKYTFYLWDLENHRQIKSPIDNIIGYPVISPNGAYMAGITSADKGGFTIWDLTTGTSNHIQGAPSSFSSDDKYLAVADNSGDTSTVNVLNAKTGEKINNEQIPGSFTGFLSGADGEVIVVWDGKKGGYLRYNITGDKIGELISAESIMFNPDGQSFAAYNYLGGISLWRASDPNPNAELPDQLIRDQLISFSADGKILITKSANTEGFTEISFWDVNWDANTVKRHGEPFTYHGSFTELRVSDNRKTLAIFGNQGVYAWDLDNPDSTKPFIKDTSGEANRMVFSPDGKTLATVGTDGIILWDLSKPKPIASLLIKGSRGDIADIAFKEDNKTLVYVDADGSFFKLDIATQRETKSEKTLIPSNACRVRLSPHGDYLAYKSGKILHVWDVDGNFEFPDIEGSKGISCNGPMAFSENGNRLAYGEGNRITVYAFDEKGKAAKNIELTGDDINDLTFVNDKILAATGGDGRIFLWDLDARTLFGTFDQPGQAKSFAFDKLQIYLPSEMRLIQINFEDKTWQSLLKNWQADICSKVGRVLTSHEWQQYFSDSDYPEKNRNCPMPTMVSGHLYYDANGNGAQDDVETEPNLSNVDVLIKPSSGAALRVTTDENGNWIATVLPGNIVSNVDETDKDFRKVFPAGWKQTEGTDPTTVTAVAGMNFTDNDGYYIP